MKLKRIGVLFCMMTLCIPFNKFVISYLCVALSAPVDMHPLLNYSSFLICQITISEGPRAYEVTLEVHMNGAATVAVANKKIIEEYSKSLQAAGLTVSTAPDDDFEPSSGGEE